MRSKRPVSSPSLLLLVCLSALLPSGCRRSGHANRSELRLAVRADVSGFFPNPPYADESYTLYINRAIFEGLVRVDQKQLPSGVLAQRWEMPDEKTWLFTLRPGRRFSDGTLVTPEDVVASLTASTRLGWANRGDLAAIESMRVAGPDQVEMKTHEPHPALLYELPWGFILPALASSKSPVPSVGTGPYKLESWSPGRDIVFSKNPHFVEPVPFDRVRMSIVPEAGERVRMLKAGEADFIDDVSAADAGTLARDSAFKVVSGPSSRVLFLALRMDHPPFSDLRVRQAVDLAIDRGVLIEKALAGRGLPAAQLVTQAIAGYDSSIQHAKADPVKARRLLAEAGYPNGFTVRLDGPNNRYIADAAIMLEVARQLREVGIEVQANTLPKGDFYRLIETQKSQGYLFGWACEVGDAAEVLNAVIHTPKGELGSANFSGLSDAELDAMIEASHRTADPQSRTEIFVRAFRRIDELKAVIPLEIQVETFAHASHLQWEPPLNMALEISQITKRP